MMNGKEVGDRRPAVGAGCRAAWRGAATGPGGHNRAPEFYPGISGHIRVHPAKSGHRKNIYGAPKGKIGRLPKAVLCQPPGSGVWGGPPSEGPGPGGTGNGAIHRACRKTGGAKVTKGN